MEIIWGSGKTAAFLVRSDRREREKKGRTYYPRALVFGNETFERKIWFLIFLFKPLLEKWLSRYIVKQESFFIVLVCVRSLFLEVVESRTRYETWRTEVTIHWRQLASSQRVLNPWPSWYVTCFKLQSSQCVSDREALQVEVFVSERDPLGLLIKIP